MNHIVRVISICISLCAAFAAIASSQDLRNTVVPITKHKVGISGKSRIPYQGFSNPLSYLDVMDTWRSDYGTGFCIDPACRFIGTNYHVAANLHPGKINGEKVIGQYLATGPDDEGATVLAGLSTMKFNLSRDLAIFELRHSLPHHHGLAFSLDELQVGQSVEIYAYPLAPSIHPTHRRSLQQFQGAYKGQTPSGLLAFEYHSSVDRTIRPGASGGVVVDSKTQQIVAILSGVAQNSGAIALAVPVRSLAEFVSKVQPYLAERVFPRTNAVSPVAADLYPKVVAPPADALQRRPEEPDEVKQLRTKAQLLGDSMSNFIAMQTFAWGSGDKEPVAEAAYEVQVIDGFQRFREFTEGKELQSVPLPHLDNAFVPGGEWSELPQWVGTKLNLKIRQMPDAVVNGRQTKVFQYQASREDGLCKWDIGVDYGFFATSKIFDTGVYGEVWTDKDLNILRISEHCEIPETFKWKNYWAVVTYGWLRQPNASPHLIPVTIYAQTERNKKTYWCRGQFTDYRVFSTRAKVGN